MENKPSEILQELLVQEDERLCKSDNDNERGEFLEAIDEFNRLIEAGVLKRRGNTLQPMDNRFLDLTRFNSSSV